jgi:serine/threonine protein phosphatase PrpC
MGNDFSVRALTTTEEKKERVLVRRGTANFESIVAGWADMQGDRRSMEDDHVACNLGNGCYLFGVFDGHGGRLASRLCREYLGRIVKQSLDLSS